MFALGVTPMGLVKDCRATKWGKTKIFEGPRDYIQHFQGVLSFSMDQERFSEIIDPQGGKS